MAIAPSSRNEQVMRSTRLLLAVCGIAILGYAPGGQILPKGPASDPPGMNVRDAARFAELFDRAEEQRADGRDAEAVQTLTECAVVAGPQNLGVRELICWRLLPTASADRERFRHAVAGLRHSDSAWLPVFELVLCSLDG